MLGLVLGRRAFREYDQIVSLYTKEKGKIEVLARGVKKIKSKNSAHLEPFSLVDVGVERGKEIDHLTKVQPVNYFVKIRKDLDKSITAGYVVALLEKLSQVGEGDNRLFDLVISWLEFLESVEKVNNFLVDAFVIKLLVTLGFAPELDGCVVCDKTDLENIFGFYPAGGGVICGQCKKGRVKIGHQVFDCGLEEIKDLRLLIKNNWSLVNNLKFEGKEFLKVHVIIYNFLIFHSEKKISDWQKINPFQSV